MYLSFSQKIVNRLLIRCPWFEGSRGLKLNLLGGRWKQFLGVAGPQFGIPQKLSKVFSSAHISLKWLLMSRNRGVHETSVSWPSSDKGQV